MCFRGGISEKLQTLDKWRAVWHQEWNEESLSGEGGLGPAGVQPPDMGNNPSKGLSKRAEH